MGPNQSASTASPSEEAAGAPLEILGMSEAARCGFIRGQLAINACALETPSDRVYFVQALSEVLPTNARVDLFKELVGQLLQVISRERPGVPSRVPQLLTEALIARLDRQGFFDIRVQNQVAEAATMHSLMIANALPEESLAAVVHDSIKSVTDEMAGNELTLCILCEMNSMYRRANSSKDLCGVKLDPKSWANSLFAIISPQP
jgi:hypothetical protein